MKNNILVIGAQGMVGTTVMKYLSQTSPKNVFGTSRNKSTIAKNIYYLEVATFEKNLRDIIKKIQNINCIINCIGELNDFKEISELINTNALFPHRLASFCEKNNINLIHISTDGVFSNNCGKVNESSLPNPENKYGYTKFLGEVNNKNAITIRTSFLSCNVNTPGLLSKIKKDKTIYGYANQNWTGCTTLQFAILCKYLLEKSTFEKIRNKTPIIHFSPIGPISKFEIIKSYLNITQSKHKLIKSKGIKINRILATKYFDLLKSKQYTTDITKALKEEINFYNLHK